MSPKVLIIDDSPVSRQFISRGLRDESLELLFADAGREGIAIAEAHAPDLILLDVEMPPPDGFETCRLLKASELTRDIPIIFLTRRSAIAEKAQGLDLGAIDYITKPFEVAELCARVRTGLRTRFMADLLCKRAMIDGLTGLWNHAFFDQRLRQEVSIASRYGSPLSLIFADVDFFKSINDTHGYPFGDRVLRLAAETIATCCRREDTACRFDGEEFAILTPRIAEPGARVLAERLRQSIGAHSLPHRNEEVFVSCSFGVAQLQGANHIELLAAAGRALVAAKDAGRNRVIGASDASPLRLQKVPA